jgi:hypothetical protein
MQAAVLLSAVRSLQFLILGIGMYALIARCICRLLAAKQIILIPQLGNALILVSSLPGTRACQTSPIYPILWPSGSICVRGRPNSPIHNSLLQTHTYDIRRISCGASPNLGTGRLVPNAFADTQRRIVSRAPIIKYWFNHKLLSAPATELAAPQFTLIRTDIGSGNRRARDGRASR